MLKLTRHPQTNEIMGYDTKTGWTFWVLDPATEWCKMWNVKAAQAALESLAHREGVECDLTPPPRVS